MSKGLIVQGKSLEKIYHNNKIWEQRPIRTAHRGKFYFIEWGTGLITGKADLVDCLNLSMTERQSAENYEKHQISDFESLRFRRYSWVLENVHKFDEPIPFEQPKGAIMWVVLPESFNA